MKKQGLIIGGVVAVVAAVGVFAFVAANQADAPESSNSTDHSNMDSMNNDKSASTETSSDAGEVLSDDVSMNIQNFAYTQPNITVKKGTKVTWTNQDSVRHDVNPDEDKTGAPESELLAKGESYSFTFDTVGEFSYHCTPHPYMKGKVTVVEQLQRII